MDVSSMEENDFIGIYKMHKENGQLMNEVIKNFKSQRKVKNILFVGLPAAGKSSLINSLVSLFLGKYFPVASVGEGNQLTHTYASHRYEHFGITDDHLRDSPNEVNARIVHPHLPNLDDFVGLGNENTKELKEILDLKVFGHLEPGIQITGLLKLQNKHGVGCLKSWYTKSKEEWKTDVVFFVHSVATKEIPEHLIECLLEVIKPKDALHPVDVELYVVLTKMDKVKSGAVSKEILNAIEDDMTTKFGFRGFKKYKLVKVTNWSDDIEFPTSSTDSPFGWDERSVIINNQLLKLLRNMSISKAEPNLLEDISLVQKIWFALYGFLARIVKQSRDAPRDTRNIFLGIILGFFLLILVFYLMGKKM